jgi:hypothetical protein
MEMNSPHPMTGYVHGRYAPHAIGGGRLALGSGKAMNV